LQIAYVFPLIFQGTFSVDYQTSRLAYTLNSIKKVAELSECFSPLA